MKSSITLSAINLSKISSSNDSSTSRSSDPSSSTTNLTKGSVPPPGSKVNKHSTDYVIRSLIAGGVSGCAAKTAVAPLDRVKILFQVSNPSVRQHQGSLKGIFRAMQEIYGLHGIPGLFQGHGATVLRIYPYAAIKFMAFEQFKVVFDNKQYINRNTKRFIAGSLAGVTSVFFTYPLDLLRARMAYEVKNPLGIVAMSRTIYREQNAGSLPGIFNFYRGFFPTMLGIVPYAGFSFWSQSILTNLCRDYFPEYTTKVVEGKPTSERPLKRFFEFSCGGAAGAIAQTISYPIEVIRRRMQVAGVLTTSRPGIAQVARQVFQERGFRGFFAGLSIGYIKVTPMSAIAFFTYAEMKQLLNME